MKVGRSRGLFSVPMILVSTSCDEERPNVSLDTLLTIECFNQFKTDPYVGTVYAISELQQYY